MTDNDVVDITIEIPAWVTGGVWDITIEPIDDDTDAGE
jgi:hypothetical protein